MVDMRIYVHEESVVFLCLCSSLELNLYESVTSLVLL
jgi:hypothetical protein